MKIHRCAEDALAAVQSEHRVFIHGAAATPNRLIDGLMNEASRLRNVELVHLHTIGSARYADPAYRESFRVSAFFIGGNMRSRFDADRVDYVPCVLSEIPSFFRSKRIPLDVALIHVSPPDRHGFCTLGTSVDATRSAIDAARIIIAQINPQMPRVHGDGFVHVDKIHHAVEVNEPIPEEIAAPPSSEELTIGMYVSQLIEDGSTLQVGIGSIPDAILTALTDRRHLGLHTEMWTDGALRLIQCGAIDNSRKVLHPGKTVAGFVMGSRKLYDFIHDNPSVVGLDIGYVNNPFNIARNPRVAAINSAVEIDLTGQICADSVGTSVISGAGGQMDFMLGASYSDGGKPIIALTSRTKKGISRIVPTLKVGAGVVTPRTHVHYVVTEFGAAYLHGKSLSERARLLIGIAHPADRERLEQEWKLIHHPWKS